MSGKDSSVLQWFPGHMAKTRREISQDLKSVELVAVLLDARIPKSSVNPEINKIIGEKPKMILLNKSDLADPAVTADWLRHFTQREIPALPVDCQSGKGLREFPAAVREILKDKIERDTARGMKKAIRIMVVGIPNVGKSSLINRMCGGKRAKVEDRPGVTRNKQWIRLENGLELLDTPGVLWPKFEDEKVGLNLAFTGAIRDDIFDVEWVAMQLLSRLSSLYPSALTNRYKITDMLGGDGVALLSAVGRNRGFLMAGGEIDTLRAATAVLDDFRGGRVGRISLEKPRALQ